MIESGSRKLGRFIFCLTGLSVLMLFAAGPTLALDQRPHADNLVPEEYATIQEAIDASTPHDTVTVAPGTYFERIAYGGKSIVVRSEQGAEVTVIDGQYEGLVVDLGEGTDSTTVFEGFTVTHGGAEGERSVTALFGTDCSAAVRNNIFTNNGLELSGSLAGMGGPAVTRCWIEDNIIARNTTNSSTILSVATDHCYITGNVIHDNTGDDMIRLYMTAGVISDNLIYRNRDTDGGLPRSGIYAVWGGPLEIVGNWVCGASNGAVATVYPCSVRNNLMCHNGVGVYFIGGAAGEILHNTIVGSSAVGIEISYSGALVESNVVVNSRWGIRWEWYTSAVQLTTNSLWNNETDYVNAAHDQGTDLHFDPLFVDAANHDFRLRPDSPLIDSGADLGAYGFKGPAPDIGAYELPYATPATAAIHLTIDPRRVAPGDTISYTLTIEDSALPFAEAVRRGDAWIELTGQRIHHVLATRSAIPIRPGASHVIEGTAAIPDPIPSGPYRVKARWGSLLDEIEASDVVDLEIGG